MLHSRTIVEERAKNVVIMDVFSKLIQERIIFIDDVITDDLANEVIAQMLYLDSLDSKKPINIYINTRGGSVTAGLAIYDIAEKIKAPIRTVAMGQCCSMGIPLMLMGAERCATKRTRFMMHQISSGGRGTLTDLKIDLRETEILEGYLYQIIAERTGKSYEQVAKDCDRDYWLSSEEALNYNIINQIL